ncbi:MAG TPA: hypothetical protein VM308_08075 [Sphingomicrobium sp.]|nr:hypothetical protein [Sphingomicrobium sp.]
MTEQKQHEPPGAEPADALSLYVWRKPATEVAVLAARSGIGASAVVAGGAFLAALTLRLFWTGHYWPGIACALLFSFTAAVAVRLAADSPAIRVQRVIDVVHPPFWWWAWQHGLAAHGKAAEPVLATMILAAIVGGYIADLTIAWIAKRRHGVAIDRWRPFDSRFRLIAAHRNVNLLILAGALSVGRPALGLKLVAWWTLASAIVHAVRLAQMNERAGRARAIRSWLD